MRVTWTGSAPARRDQPAPVHLILLHRLDDTHVASVNVGIGKARTAAIYRRPSKEFEVSSCLWDAGGGCEDSPGRGRGSGEDQRELLAQDHAGAVQPRLHRRDRLPEELGHVLVRETLDVP